MIHVVGRRTARFSLCVCVGAGPSPERFVVGPLVRAVTLHSAGTMSPFASVLRMDAVDGARIALFVAHRHQRISEHRKAPGCSTHDDTETRQHMRRGPR